MSFELSSAPRRPAARVIEIPPQRLSDANETIDKLERELAYTKDSLQNAVEQLATSNEELQATNEELVASNEELQSTNEELHSVNEELHTVNAEHQSKIQELTQVTADMDNLLLSTRIGTIFLDGDLRIRRYTPAIAEAFYLLPQDIGRPIDHIANNLELGDIRELSRNVLRTGKPIEREVRNADNNAYLLRLQPYFNINDENGVVLTCVDISSILSSYDEIRRTAESLDLTDRDLQEFAYAVSHEMQAPVRHIRNHLQYIREDWKDSSPPIIDKHFSTIETCLDRIETMLHGLLRYSRVYSRGRPLTWVSCDDILDRARRRIASLLEEHEAVIIADELPHLVGDDDQLVEVFTELLTNSIQFAREKPPKIQLNAERGDNYWRIDISDNGIGIAPQHRERVFVIFERLEFRTVPGQGMGLPLCKRIMQRHSGSIQIMGGINGRGITVRLIFPVDATRVDPNQPKLPPPDSFRRLQDSQTSRSNTSHSREPNANDPRSDDPSSDDARLNDPDSDGMMQNFDGFGDGPMDVSDGDSDASSGSSKQEVFGTDWGDNTQTGDDTQSGDDSQSGDAVDANR